MTDKLNYHLSNTTCGILRAVIITPSLTAAETLDCKIQGSLCGDVRIHDTQKTFRITRVIRRIERSDDGIKSFSKCSIIGRVFHSLRANTTCIYQLEPLLIGSSFNCSNRFGKRRNLYPVIFFNDALFEPFYNATLKQLSIICDKSN